ncbi:MAG: hypothetical protein HZA52_11935 [Planctomycetes bacterium]|nr:hypothetical protein [Planctomycetota bacterium]
MFCQLCGTANTDTATACASCSTPISTIQTGARTGAGSPAVADTVKATSKDAFAAFKTLAVDPVGALPRACESLGDAKALRSGVAFGIVSVLCFASAGPMLLGMRMSELYEFLGFAGVLKLALFAAIPFLGTALGGSGARRILAGRGGLGSDCFVAGAALLPASACMLGSGLLGFENVEVIGVLAVFAGCLGILMLYSGYTRVAKLSERAGSLAVPIVVLLTVWLAKIALSKVLSGSFGGDSPY